MRGIPSVVHDVLRGAGQPLDAPTRKVMEPLFGRDLSSVRVHSDDQAGASARAVDALAYTVGHDVVFDSGRYQPGSPEGRELLAHELAHVVQQRAQPHSPGSLPVPLDNPALESEADQVASRIFSERINAVTAERVPALRMKEKPKATTQPPASPAPVAISVSLSGILFSPAENAKLVEAERQPQLMAMAVHRLMPLHYKPGIEKDIVAKIEAKLPKMAWRGTLISDYIAEANEPAGQFFLDQDVAQALVSILDEEYHEVNLTDEQKELVSLGAVSVLLWDDLRDQMPYWYSRDMFQREMSQNADLLRQYAKSRTAAGSDRTLVQTIADQVLAPINVLEQIRTDIKLATHPKAADAYRAIWNLPKGVVRTPPDELVADWIGALFLSYVRTQPVYSKEALTSSDARATLLHRFAQFITRASVSASGDEKLFSSPALANQVALTSRLFSTPPLSPPLFDVSQEAELSVSMDVDFPDVYDAFAPYEFSWERVKVPDSVIEKNRKERAKLSVSDVRDRQSATLKKTGEALKGADPTKLKGEQATTGEWASHRISQASRYNQEDMDMLISGSGADPGIGTLTLVAANALLRYIGAGVRIALELFTRSHKPGHSEQSIVFPEPGFYFVRCAAIPVLTGDKAVVRPPSIAYLPVFARDPKEIAETSAAATAEDQFDTPKEIERLRLLLQAAPNAKERQKIQDELEALEASQVSTGHLLEVHRDHLNRRKKELETRLAAINEGVEKGDPKEVARDLKQLKNEIEEIEKRLETRDTRTDALKGARPLPATFVGDFGQRVQLDLELREYGIEDGKYHTYISDITTPKSGEDSGYGFDAMLAIDDAIGKVLASTKGYGRGYVSYVYGTDVRTVRITSTEGALLSEALDNIAMALTVAAVVAAPFTGGASLVLLVPAGIVGAIPSAYRLEESYRTGTLHGLDLDTAMDVINVATSFLSLGRLATAGRTGLTAMRVERGLMIIGLGMHGLGVIVMGAAIIDQLIALDADQTITDSEKKARLLMIFGNLMVQAGVMVGEKVWGQGHARLGAEQKREGAAAPLGEHEGAPVHEAGGAAQRDGSGRTPRILGDEKAGIDPGDRAALARDVSSKESLFNKLSGEGVRPEEGKPTGPQPTIGIEPGKPRTGVRDVHEAHSQYDLALEANGGKKEVAIFRNLETGEYAVSVGSETEVRPPDKGRWEGVLHYHPNRNNAKQFRLPAPADFAGPMQRYLATGETAREFLEYDLPGVGRGRSEFGITKGEEKPFYVTVYLPDGSSSTVRFAHDGSYTAYWSGEKTFVDPGSPLYKAMLADVPSYLNSIEHAAPATTAEPEKTAAGLPKGGNAPEKPAPVTPAEVKQPETLPSSKHEKTAPVHDENKQKVQGEKTPVKPQDKTTGSTGAEKAPPAPDKHVRDPTEPPKPLMTAHGDLTPEGLEFLKNHKKYGKWYKGLTDDQIQEAFRKGEKPEPVQIGVRGSKKPKAASGAKALEAVVGAEIRAYWNSLGESDTRLLLDKPGQKFSQVATALEKFAKRTAAKGTKVNVNRAPLNMSTEEFFRTNLPDVLDFMDNHPDPDIRGRWMEFSRGGRNQKGGKVSKGFLEGKVGDKQPDFIEMFFDRELAVATDASYAKDDPLHNVKSLFYGAVIEKMTGLEAGTVDYRSSLRQTVTDLGSLQERAAGATQ